MAKLLFTFFVVIVNAIFIIETEGELRWWEVNERRGPSMRTGRTGPYKTEGEPRWWEVNERRGLNMLLRSLARYSKRNLINSYDSSTVHCMRVASAQIVNGLSPRPSETCQRILQTNVLTTSDAIYHECRLSDHRKYRRTSGHCNDLKNLWAGAINRRFGRNSKSFVPKNLYYPDPFLIARKLFTRKKFIPARYLNIFATSFFQFMIHDMIFHFLNLRAPPIYRSKNSILRTQSSHGSCVQSEDRETQWLDGSQLYGSNGNRSLSLRTHCGGKLKIGSDKSLPRQNGTEIPLVGFGEGWWVGLHTIHVLFTLEHNAICDMLAQHYPKWDDQKLYVTARLINVAVIAKIQILEWNKAVTRNPVISELLDRIWRGTRAKKSKRYEWESRKKFPVRVSGLSQNNHGVTYSVTEEFVSMCRMHSLMPEVFPMWDAKTYRKQNKIRKVAEMNTQNTVRAIHDEGLDNILLTTGMEKAGAMVLDNFPNFLHPLTGLPPDPSREIDVAGVDILRDRERGVPRYNEFRRQLGLRPAKSFLELTGGNTRIAKRLAELYQKVDRVDLVVGMHVEQPRPSGFSFSDTFYQLYVLMMRRSLEADRFFTTDYRKEIYSEKGMEWINSANMKDILIRHFPVLKPALRGVTNPFVPWKQKELHALFEL